MSYLGLLMPPHQEVREEKVHLDPVKKKELLAHSSSQSLKAKEPSEVSEARQVRRKDLSSYLGVEEEVLGTVVTPPPPTLPPTPHTTALLPITTTLQRSLLPPPLLPLPPPSLPPPAFYCPTLPPPPAFHSHPSLPPPPTNLCWTGEVDSAFSSASSEYSTVCLHLKINSGVL